MKTRVLLTGANTLVGAEILRELLCRPEIGSVVLAMPREEPVFRRELDRLQDYLGYLPDWITPLGADVTLSRFGLSPTEWEKLSASIDIGFHCAQRETKDQNLNLARANNVRPTEDWIDLLGRNPQLRLHHLSTGFIAGTRRGLLTESDLACGQGFHNAWERSKFEAEVRFRESDVSDRVNIYRPSHTLGRASTGQAFEFGGAYPLLSTLAASRLLPGDPRARIDLVPADFVATSMVALAQSGASGTFHLAGGWERSLEVRTVARIVAKATGRSRAARLIPRGLAWPLQLFGTSSSGGLADRRVVFTSARDQLHQGSVFDSFLADVALGPPGIAPPPNDWLERVVQWADERRWKPRPADDFDEPIADAGEAGKESLMSVFPAGSYRSGERRI